ncbi:hypothetical protein VTH8203_02640 [Vibrio thalassae]|uniref:Transporter suffix domain-containing protein n=1 Tax=Vibrio thalassae TaxID=1243014 RepID=A0A240EL95_9VIBR|nr:hypothetical protein [Vibrio thalassae]SNX49003.1 hypothetical protein VTH8203_02640 [Vibrio thalassae]
MKKIRLFLGVCLLVIAFVSPLFIPFITSSNLCSSQKALLSGLMIFGIPEFASIGAIFLLGRERLQQIKSFLVGTLLRLKPSRQSTKFSYYLGVSLMVIVGPIMNIALFYLSSFFPDWVVYRQPIGLICDFVFVLSLFIAGEQLWGKIEAIFRFHPPKSSEN